MRDDVDHKLLLRQLVYDPDTGIFTRVAPSSTRVRAGDVAGHTVNGSGYVAVGFAGKRYLAHRLAWFYVYGRFPDGSLDHINGVRHDNRIANLREATTRENSWNMANHRTGDTPCVRPRRNGFDVVVSIGGKRRYIGHYQSRDEAKSVVKNALAEFEGGDAWQLFMRQARNLPRRDTSPFVGPPKPPSRHAQNLSRSLPTNKSTGVLGVRALASGRFKPEIEVVRSHGVRFRPNLGTYDTVEEASAAYQTAKAALHRG